MTRLSGAFALAAFLSCAAGCGDDTTGTGGSGGSPSDGGGDTGGAPAGGAPQAGGGGASSDGGGGSGTGGAGGAANECAALAPGPFDATLVTSAFSGSEDLAFDGTGGIVAKDGNNVVRVDASDNKTTIAAANGQSYGVRFGSDGALFVAQPGSGQLLRIDGGNVTTHLSGLSSPNGVYGDLDGNVYVTEFSGNQIIRVDVATAAVDVIVDGSPAAQPNGVVFDDARGLLFFSNYSQGRVYSVDPAGASEPVLVGEVSDAALDGLVLDVCGNVYAVDNANNRVYRLNLDAAGALVGQPELIAQLPTNVANAQFGAGDGWSATSLYVAGNPGDVYEVPVGVAGAPVPVQ